MAKLRGIDKAERVLRFLFGLRNRHVAVALGARGLRDADIAEAWALFHGMTRRHVEGLREDPARRRFDDVAAWVERWLPIVLATLGRHAPPLREHLAAVASRASHEPAVAGAAMLEQIDKLAANPDDPVRAVLERRGVTAEVMAEGRRLLAQFKQLPAVPEDEEDEATFAQAEKELWSWYLEWSAIARSAIREPSLLRALGFSTRGGISETVPPA